MEKVKLLIRDGMISVGLLTIACFIGLWLDSITNPLSLISMVFVLTVFIISLLTSGYIWGIAASLFSVLIVNYVFTFPYLAFDFLVPFNLISAIVMLIVAISTCTLTTKLKAQEKIVVETETEKMRSNLLRAISHDLRTPLTTIYGSCSAIIENYNSISEAQQKKLLLEMREDAENLIRIVENLLSVTRVNGETVAVRKTATVLEELIDSVLMKFQKNHPNQHVIVTIPDEFISIPMDALLIEQVLINLLENAVHHATGMTELYLSVTVEKTNAIFKVEDNGCGIPRDKLDQLFTGQLYRKDLPSDSNRGLAIGLSVCSAIIKAHGSMIYAENLKNGGASFYFSLEMEDKS